MRYHCRRGKIRHPLNSGLECWNEVLKGRDAIAKGNEDYVAKAACACDTQSTEVEASKQLAQVGSPELVEFFRKTNVGIGPVSQTAAEAVENDIQGKWEKAAIHYLKTCEERLKTWVLEENYNKVKATLEKARASGGATCL